MKRYSKFQSLILVTSTAVLALSGCGKEVQRTGGVSQPQGTPKDIPVGREEFPKPAVASPSPSPTSLVRVQVTPRPDANNENEEERNEETKVPVQTQPRATIPNGPIANGPVVANGPVSNRPIPNGPIANGPIANGEIVVLKTRTRTENSSTSSSSTASSSPRNTPRSETSSSRTSSCRDNTGLPNSAKKVTYEKIVSGKLGTWQLVSFKAYAKVKGASGYETGSSSIQGTALDRVTVSPVCQDGASMGSDSLSWEMTLPMLFASRDGSISDEIHYREVLEGSSNEAESQNHVAVRSPTKCKVITPNSYVSQGCGTFEFYSQSKTKAYVTQQGETFDDRGNPYTVRMTGTYAWVAGESMMNSIPDPTIGGAALTSTLTSRNARTSPGTPSFGTADDGDTVAIGATSETTSQTTTQTTTQTMEMDQYDSYGPNDGETLAIGASGYESSSEYGIDSEYATGVNGSAQVVFVGQRPCCCSVITKKQVRKMKRAIRRATRETANRCSSRVIRSCS